MKLSKRLLMSANMVTKLHVTADIGCDHGYTSLHLVQQGIAPHALAMDLRPGPLSRAKENIEKYGLQEKIETRLSDGMEKLMPGEADTILISGMGGELITQILSKRRACADLAKELILQPQSAIPFVRRYLHNEGLRIIAEDMCWEEGKFYTSIKAIPGQSNICPLQTENELLYYEFGKQLLEQKHPVLYTYLERQYEKKTQIREQLLRSDTEAAKRRLLELSLEINLLVQAKAWYNK